MASATANSSMVSSNIQGAASGNAMFIIPGDSRYWACDSSFCLMLAKAFSSEDRVLSTATFRTMKAGFRSRNFSSAASQGLACCAVEETFASPLSVAMFDSPRMTALYAQLCQRAS